MAGKRKGRIMNPLIQFKTKTSPIRNPMNRSPLRSGFLLIALAGALFALSPQARAAAAGVQVQVEQSQVRLLRSGKTIAICRTQLPEIEKWKLINGNRQIVVKSRGRHGPAAVELFNVMDGSLADKVMAFAITNGKPEWARGFEE
jgi:hypothetical protein